MTNQPSPRIRALDLSEAPGPAKALLAGVKEKLGIVPNIFRTFAHAPAVLDMYLKQSGALAAGALSPALREQIALVTAGTNRCDYCASAHTALGKGAGLEAAEMTLNLAGQSQDSKTQAALEFARKIVTRQGNLADADLQAVRDAGYSEGEIVEIVANVALNIFTNYFNHIAATVVDFPLVATTQTQNAA